MYWLLSGNSALARLVRTILQGFAGVLVASLPQLQEALIYMLGEMGLAEVAIAAIVPIVMAVLSPAMARLGALVETSNLPSHDNCVVCDANGLELPLDAVLELAPEAVDENV